MFVRSQIIDIITITMFLNPIITISNCSAVLIIDYQKVTITQGGVYLPGKRASLPVLEIRDPQIWDPDPRIFTGIQIRDPREKQCGSPTHIPSY